MDKNYRYTFCDVYTDYCVCTRRIQFHVIDDNFIYKYFSEMVGCARQTSGSVSKHIDIHIALNIIGIRGTCGIKTTSLLIASTKILLIRKG